jgi:selenocysteine lyase/cysteine desulfurase
MPDFNRRQIMAATLAIASGSMGLPERAQARMGGDDEQFWAEIALEYDLDDRYTVLNGGGNNPLPRRVTSALLRYQQMAASQPRPFNYQFISYRDEHRRRLARLFGCKPGELALTRNTTEGLNTVARGLAFERGDRVLLSPFEEHYAYRAFEPLATRYGVELKVVDLPVAPTAEQVVSAFARELTPRTRLLVASHIVDSWGYVLPVAELAKLAHDAGARLLVDGALSFGHIPVDVQQLGCDYFATSLHKWLNAPLGTGVLFVREDRIEELWPLYGVRGESGDIRKFESIGTRDGAAIAAIGQAIDFYELIGPERKAERLRFLLSSLIERLEGASGVQIVTEPDPARRAGLARVVVEGWTGVDLTTALRDRYGFYAYGNFPGELDGVYVSPNVFNSTEDLERFAAAVTELAA